MPENKNITSNFIITAGIFAILTAYALNNISDSNFWYDETIQFLISKGLSFQSPPLTPEANNIIDIIKTNSLYNLDPGGFSILLHLLTLFNHSTEWLRMIPYLFFTGTVFFAAVIIKELTGSIKPALIAGLLFFIIPSTQLIQDFAFELRAYSMEACGILCCIYFFLKFYKKPESLNLLILGLISTFFIGSRYSFWIFILVFSFAIFVYMFKSSVKTFLLKGYLYYLPVFFSFMFYIINSLIPQLFIKKYNFSYTKHAILGCQNFSEKINIFWQNFLSAESISITVFIIIFVLMGFTGIKTKIMSDKNEFIKFKFLFFIIILYNSIFILLSFLKIHPWLINAKWSIGLNTLSLVCSLALFALFYLYFIKDKKIKGGFYLSLFFSVIIFVSGFYSVKDREFPKNNSFLANFKNFEKKDKKFFERYFYVAPKTYSTLKFHFEYGEFSSDKYRKIYPQNFLTHLSNSDMPEIIKKLPHVDVIIVSGYIPSEKKQLLNLLNNIVLSDYYYFNNQVILRKNKKK